MARPNISLSRTVLCPNIVTTDSTSYPTSPDNHRVTNYRLYKLVVYDMVAEAREKIYSSIDGIGEELLDNPTAGFIYEIEPSKDSLFKLSFYCLPVSEVGTNYSLNDCIIYGTTVYKCTTAGTLNNDNPALSTGAIFSTLTSDSEIHSDYVEEFYSATVCGYAETYSQSVQKSLIDNLEVCPKINNDEEFMRAMKIIELFNYGNIIQPTVAELATATARNRAIEAFNKLSTICTE